MFAQLKFLSHKNMNLNQMKTNIGIGLMVIAFGFMGWNVLALKAADGAENPYNNDQIPLEQVMTDYHKYVNDTFNTYIKKMLVENQKNPQDPNGKPPQPADPNGAPLTSEEAEKVCLDKPENYSTYCLAVRLLGNVDDPKQKGYLNYKKALETRRNFIFDTAAEKDAYNKFITAVTCAGVPGAICDEGKQTEKVQAVYQTQKLLSISSRTEAIDHEIEVSKNALNKTLAAYDQLRVTFPMHLAYRKIFDELINYRDQLVQLRDQTDHFPSRFVDVATLKCT